MRITVDLDETLLRQAQAATGISAPKTLLEEGLRGLARRKIARSLIALGGTMPWLKGIRRRRVPL